MGSVRRLVQEVGVWNLEASWRLKIKADGANGAVDGVE